jgi:hypothetical protein
MANKATDVPSFCRKAITPPNTPSCRSPLSISTASITSAAIEVGRMCAEATPSPASTPTR